MKAIALSPDLAHDELLAMRGAWGARAPPKNHQKWFKAPKKSILECVCDTYVFEGGFGEDFGWVLG